MTSGGNTSTSQGLTHCFIARRYRGKQALGGSGRQRRKSEERERHGDSREMNMALHVATLYVCYFPRLFATWPFTSLLQLLDSRRALTLQLGMLDWGRLGEQGNTVSKRQQKCPGCIFTDTYNVKGKSEQL